MQLQNSHATSQTQDNKNYKAYTTISPKQQSRKNKVTHNDNCCCIDENNQQRVILVMMMRTEEMKNERDKRIEKRKGGDNMYTVCIGYTFLELGT